MHLSCLTIGTSRVLFATMLIISTFQIWICEFVIFRRIVCGILIGFTPIPEELKVQILDSCIWLQRDLKDCLAWLHGRLGKYTTSSGYDWVYQKLHGHVHSRNWSWVWHLPMSKKCCFLVWLALQDALPTASLRHRYGLTMSCVCGRYQDQHEDVLHCLRDCVRAEIWDEFRLEPSFFHHMDFCS